MTHQEFQSVLCSVLKSFLNCVEGLQALNGSLTEVIESIRSVTDTRTVDRSLIFCCRPPALPSELTAMHDSLFDTLSSSAEVTNVLPLKSFPLERINTLS
ncbi:hypothetical protein EDB92DRAFT_619350 [Lactarius akahatsu]|uniref:Uncharacterized protein n=1 Tax=Lactarius akahatsu TaxID=416441 RepID=A0AAD4LKK3_9AGAM|nr:hypothetical protein EDB92DRAFT_619350 [Lactarius akahatsu]